MQKNKSIEIAIHNLKRLNKLRVANKLNQDSWQEFFLYKRIVKANDIGEYDDETNSIINYK